MARLTGKTCEICGMPLEEYEVYDKDTGETVRKEISCPYEWRESHQ